MKSERSIGIFMLVGSLFCLTVAADKYYSAVVTANALTEELPEIELDSVGIPTVSLVCGTLGVTLFVASVISIAKSFQPAEPEALKAE